MKHLIKQIRAVMSFQKPVPTIQHFLVMRQDQTIDIVNSLGITQKRDIYSGYVPKNFTPDYHD